MRAIFYITVLICIFCSNNSKAQTQFTVNFGCKAGYGVTVIAGSDGNGNDTGFEGSDPYLGLSMEKKISEKWRFTPEIIISTATGIFTYLEIPLLLDYKLSSHWRIFGGAKAEIILDNYDIGIGYNIYHITPALEAGLKYQLAKRWTIEGRYGYALFNQIEDYELEVFFGKRRTARLGFGYAF